LSDLLVEEIHEPRRIHGPLDVNPVAVSRAPAGIL
jgi:hypothetical protein